MGKKSHDQYATSCNHLHVESILCCLCIYYFMNVGLYFQGIRVLVSGEWRMVVPMGYTTPLLLGKELGEMG